MSHVQARGGHGVRSGRKERLDLIVEGIPAKLWEDDDEKSLKSLLEQRTSSSPGGVVATYVDNVSDITRVGNSARCKIHTTHQSMCRFRFLLRINRVLFRTPETGSSRYVAL